MSKLTSMPSLQPASRRSALSAVAYVATDDRLTSQFVALTGCGGIEQMRDRLADRAFLGSVLDLILGDEQTTVALAERISMPPEMPMLARSKLPECWTKPSMAHRADAGRLC